MRVQRSGIAFLFAMASSVAFAWQPCGGWTRQQEASHPAPEAGAFWNRMVHDRVQDRTLLADGGDASGAVFRMRMFEYNAAGPTIWNEVSPPSAYGPALPRRNFGFCWDEANNRGVVMGGTVNGTPMYDMWFWPADNSGWISVPVSGSWPLASYQARLMYDKKRNRIYGVFEIANYGLQLWEYKDGGWFRGPDPTGADPDFQCVFDEHNDRVFLTTHVPFQFGGQVDTVAVYQPADALAAGTWTWLPSDPPYEAQIEQELVYDSSRHRVLKFGGRRFAESYDYPDGWPGHSISFTYGDGIGYWDDSTSSWKTDNGEYWTLSVDYLFPSYGRSGASAVYDRTTDRVVMFGGSRKQYLGCDPVCFPDIVNWSDTWVLEQRVPGFVTEPETIQACAGQPLTLKSLASGGPPISYQWYLDNNPIFGATSATLPLGAANSASTPGNYHVVVSNDCGQTRSRTAVVTVVDPVQILTQPADLIACPGPNSLAGPVINEPAQPATYTWERQTGEFGWDVVASGPNPHLFFAQGLHDDSGVYRCRVENACGSHTTIPVTVQFGAVFDVQPSSPPMSSVCDDVVLSVQARTTTGAPPVYQWLLDGLELQDGPDITGAQSATLTMTNIGAEESGAFVCRVDDPLCGFAYSKPVRLLPPTVAPTGWTQRAVGGPPTRSVTALAYDAARGVTVMYGGIGDDDILGDTWEWNGTAWTERFPTLDPLPRRYHRMFYDFYRGKLLLWGGQAVGTPPPGHPSFAGWHSDLWQFDGETWSVEAFDGPDPFGTFTEAQIFHDEVRDRYTLLRANPFVGATAQVEVFNPRYGTWSLPEITPGIDIGANAGAAFDRITGEVVYHVGWPFDSQGYTRFYGVNQAGAYGWTTSMTAAPKNTYPELAFDPIRRSVVSFGSDTQSYFSTESWVLTGSSWAPLYTSGLPHSPPDGFTPDGFRALGMVFDTRRATMVVIGRHEFAPEHELEVWEYAYPACNTELCTVDFNADGFLDNGDIGAFVTYFLAGNLVADINRDGFLDNGDIGAFVLAFLAGC